LLYLSTTDRKVF